eukprot:2926954-Lingulodinium_polyedra.AAC.1
MRNVIARYVKTRQLAYQSKWERRDTLQRKGQRQWRAKSEKGRKTKGGKNKGGKTKTKGVRA